MLSKIILFVSLAMLFSSCGGGASRTGSNSVVDKIERVVETGPAIETVSINSPDGVVLVGTFLPAERPDSPALLLLHQWQSDRHSWDDLAKQLNADGFAVLAIDGRGFGESTKRADGSSVVAGRSDADVKAMLGDVKAAFDHLLKQKNVNPNLVGIIGASYGSSLALIFAADNPRVAAVALLSPGTNYFGSMATEPAIIRYRSRPVFLAAAKDDPDSFNAVTRLAGLTSDPNRAVAVTVDKGGHGKALLDVDGVRGPLVTFLKERLGVEPQK